MELIASFQVDHTKIVPGIYVSRRDKVAGGWITTFDIRMKTPNKEPVIHPNAMHTIEHIVATYLRNSDFKDHVVYWGPMGCLTGSYFITNTGYEIQPADIEPLIRAAFKYLSSYKGEVPGATAVNCGNYLLHDLQMAKWEAKEFLAKKWKFVYPKAKRIEANGKTFFDA